MGILRAGDLNRRITIERDTPTDDGFGRESAWTALRTCWASRRIDRGSERYANDQRQAQVTVIFRVRWWPGAASVTPADRINDQGQLFDILSALEIGRREGLEMMATAAVRPAE